MSKELQKSNFTGYEYREVTVKKTMQSMYADSFASFGWIADLGYICCSTYGCPRSKDFHWKHYKKLLEDNGLPDIRWHDLRGTFCTILLKNNFNPKAVSQLMGHAKEIITIRCLWRYCRNHRRLFRRSPAIY